MLHQQNGNDDSVLACHFIADTLRANGWVPLVLEVGIRDVCDEVVHGVWGGISPFDLYTISDRVREIMHSKLTSSSAIRRDKLNSSLNFLSPPPASLLL